MRIAMLAPIAWRTPPRRYGPWELVVSNITEMLVEKGLDVTLFATGDSITNATLAHCVNDPYAEDATADVKVNECLHISQLFERAEEFDILHNHYDFLPLTYSRLVQTPMVTTIHGFSSPNIVPVYKKYNGSGHYVSISHSNRHPHLDYAATIYNGINTNEFAFNNEPGGYLLFFGRIHPEKGTTEAIELAKLCGLKLVIAGLVQDEHYFENQVRPFIDNDTVIYAGNCDSLERNHLLGNARAVLHLISFDEPFGLSVVEAMCCGTPVIAFNRGSMPELIKHGKTGFLVHNMEQAITAIAALPRIKRIECRQWAMQQFSRETMADAYYELYRNILGR